MIEPLPPELDALLNAERDGAELPPEVTARMWTRLQAPRISLVPTSLLGVAVVLGLASQLLHGTATPAPLPELHASPAPQFRAVTLSAPVRHATVASAPTAPAVQTQEEDTLARELALLERARSAIRAGDERAAKTALNEHATVFPNGQLETERLALLRKMK